MVHKSHYTIWEQKLCLSHGSQKSPLQFAGLHPWSWTGSPSAAELLSGSTTSQSSTPAAQPFLAQLKTNLPAPFWFCTFTSPYTAHNNPSEQQVVISMFAFPVLAVHWRLMKISQSINCDLKRSTLIREALKSRYRVIQLCHSKEWGLMAVISFPAKMMRKLTWCF